MNAEWHKSQYKNKNCRFPIITVIGKGQIDYYGNWKKVTEVRHFPFRWRQ